MDTVVEREPVEVLRVRADMKGGGPRAAFDALESKLASLNGRRFYGVVRPLAEDVEYYACVARLPGEDPSAMGLDLGTIPGGRYIRRRIQDWQSVVAAGKLKQISQEFAQGYALDPNRPSIEYYRSMKELHVLLPLANESAPHRGSLNLDPAR